MKKIPLNGKRGQGKFALVDYEDYEELMQYKWFLSPAGYARRSVSNKGVFKEISMHRYILNCEDNLLVDHKNHNRLDNQKNNLRKCTRSQNGMNRVAKKGGTSKYKAVSFNKRRSCWQTKIVHNGKSIHIGSFDTEIEAAKAYNEKAKELFGEFAHLNKI